MQKKNPTQLHFRAGANGHRIIFSSKPSTSTPHPNNLSPPRKRSEKLTLGKLSSKGVGRWGTCYAKRHLKLEPQIQNTFPGGRWKGGHFRNTFLKISLSKTTFITLIVVRMREKMGPFTEECDSTAMANSLCHFNLS